MTRVLSRARAGPAQRLDRGQPELLESHRLRLEQTGGRDGPRTAARATGRAPRPARPTAPPGSGSDRAAPASLRPVLELEGIEPVPVDPDRVAGAVALDDVADGLAQLRDVRLERVAGGLRRCLAPTGRRSAARPTPSCSARRGGARRRAAASARRAAARVLTACPPRSHRCDDPKRSEHLESHGVIVRIRASARLADAATGWITSSEHDPIVSDAGRRGVGTTRRSPRHKGSRLRSGPSCSSIQRVDAARRPRRSSGADVRSAPWSEIRIGRRIRRAVAVGIVGATVGVTGAFAVAAEQAAGPEDLRAGRGRPPARADAARQLEAEHPELFGRANRVRTTTTCAWRPSGRAGCRSCARRSLAEPGGRTSATGRSAVDALRAAGQHGRRAAVPLDDVDERRGRSITSGLGTARRTERRRVGQPVLAGQRHQERGLLRVGVGAVRRDDDALAVPVCAVHAEDDGFVTRIAVSLEAERVVHDRGRQGVRGASVTADDPVWSQPVVVDVALRREEGDRFGDRVWRHGRPCVSTTTSG